MIESFPAEFVSKLRNGKVVGIGVPLPAAALADLEDYADHETAAIRVVGLCLAKLTSHDHLLRTCVRSVAAGAAALWPDWYGADVSAGKTGRRPKEVSPQWRERATELVASGKLPLPTDFPNAIQISQLSLTLGAPDLIIALAATDQNLSARELKSLVATAMWLAAQSQAKVALLVHQVHSTSEEFDRIIRESLGHAFLMAEAEPPVEEVPTVTITAIKGRPNPTSPGEVLLADRLAKDAELAGLFSFNQTVKSVHHKEYRVDLIWPEGKLVVEVDGHTFHSSSFAFGQDRHRDYELLITGYRVLRLTHEEIVKDTQRAIAKIRDSVHFLNKNLPYGA